MQTIVAWFELEAQIEPHYPKAGKARPPIGLISARSSTKNDNKERDPKMHPTKRRSQYYFGAKAHIGVDSKESEVHSVCTSVASVHDRHMLPDSLRGAEKKAWGDGGPLARTGIVRHHEDQNRHSHAPGHEPAEHADEHIE